MARHEDKNSLHDGSVVVWFAEVADARDLTREVVRITGEWFVSLGKGRRIDVFDAATREPQHAF